MSSLSLRLLLVALCVSIAGCSGESGPQRVRVFGIVERASSPLLSGTISFLPAKGHNGPAANGVIQDGKFDIPAAEGPTAGPHQVVVNLIAGKTTPEFASGMASRNASKRTRWEFNSDVTSKPEEFDFILKDE